MLCIYHANCADGFTAAWVVNKRYQELNVPVTFFPGIYGDENLPDVTDQNVVMVDFSYKRPVLEKLRDRAKSILILDHHKTAEADLKDLPGITSVFDMNRSGARITWDYFFEGQRAPELLYHIEDRDLWKFALHGTREIQSAVFAYPYEFNVWDDLMNADLDTLRHEGEVIERKMWKDLRELLPIVTRPMRIGGKIVKIANLPYMMASEAGNLLSEGEPFAGSYYDTPTGRIFSLRSKVTGDDVSEVAKLYGGGGHARAAGFKVSYWTARQFEVE